MIVLQYQDCIFSCQVVKLAVIWTKKKNIKHCHQILKILILRHLPSTCKEFFKNQKFPKLCSYNHFLIFFLWSQQPWTQFFLCYFFCVFLLFSKGAIPVNQQTFYVLPVSGRKHWPVSKRAGCESHCEIRFLTAHPRTPLSEWRFR